ncbi:murein L,D-transpeptidase catalytic domain family protein [Chlorobaculum sp. MV4-Y]|uniref:murein L,D-transpeptidase catalytic domain family protein n=1 Tax=Chlorobaculum sp. MV4-Y TaxID=2976335 RepID=UPI0021AE89E1|nr:murein L,D-transpeptidase catalytic domain family protein [Chlorobaculum sp. MV4-Y]UWX57280.1 murein L,D-transpeptidase catalytic domain family protein [Chlorobaculum sp. MV4-Y]
MKKRGIALTLMLFMALPVASRAIPADDSPENRWITAVMQSIKEENNIDPEALKLALKGYWNLYCEGQLRRKDVITLIDFSKPSDVKRLYIIDVRIGRILRSDLVAHGRGSGDVMATSFSNQPGSNQSSIGFYLTGCTYTGKNGYSLVLKGLDQGINDNAEMRSIVMHGADYVSEDYISRTGHLGRSLGCPAVSMERCFDLIDLIKDGSCLFIYHKDQGYASRSVVLNPELALGRVKGQNPA